MQTNHPLSLPSSAVLLERAVAYASLQLRESSMPYICAYVRSDGRLVYGAGRSTWAAIVSATDAANSGEGRTEANRIADLCHFPLWRFEGSRDSLCQVWPIEDESGMMHVAFLFKL